MTETYRPSGFFTIVILIICACISLWAIWNIFAGNVAALIFLLIAMPFGYIAFSRLNEYSLSDNELTVTNQLLRTRQTISFRDINGIETMYNPGSNKGNSLPGSRIVMVRHNGAVLTIYFYEFQQMNEFTTKLAHLCNISVVEK